MIAITTMRRNLVIYSKLENISLVEKVIDEISSAFTTSEDVYGKILIATLEAVNNAIIHGNQLDETKTVSISFNISDNELEITVEDMGPGFDYHDVPDPTLPANIENLSGRGVFLMKQLADQVVFNNTGSHVELTFRF